ncbi:hypothetical protein TUM19329_07200 [Legionella antarctica]|uniref:Uncharacterized protein n=2 Tax=Legionella antarctica TaxID=2708020 RepID=A0A6F8T1P8_9GAMM|nr:hypothetical protein TUM19329_07200 [Legionella antarctica]
MIISDLMSAKLSNLENKITDEPKGALSSPLRLIVWGINLGHVQGEEAELRQLILSYLTDPAAIGIINKAGEYSTSVISALLYNFSGFGRTAEVKANILSAFRILFEKNPCSIMSHVLVELEEGEGKTVTESAIERIGNFNLQEELEPELLFFIKEHALNLNEIELRRLVYGIHNNPRLMQQVTLSLGHVDSSCFERNGMPADKLEHSILNHWFSDHRGDLAFFFHDFPVIEMWRLFMDGDQQKNGWRYYEAREKGCINQLYQGWVYIRQTMNMRLTPDYFKTIHAICAKGM